MAIDNSNNDAELWQKLGKMEADIQNVSKQVESVGRKIDRLDLTPITKDITTLNARTDTIDTRLKKVEENQSKLA